VTREKTQAALPWAFVGLLVILCGFLAYIQNRWINELGDAERARLRLELQRTV
jgi:hypothetical protein